MVFASGFLAISLEIVWFRVFGTLMHSDAYVPWSAAVSDLCPPNTDVTVSAIYKCHPRSLGSCGGLGAESSA
jgi:hypothetical protein